MISDQDRKLIDKYPTNYRNRVEITTKRQKNILTGINQLTDIQVLNSWGYWVDCLDQYFPNEFSHRVKPDLSMTPVFKNGEIVEVGHKIKCGGIKEIVRVDPNTRQVWYKTGGFDWFESMKKYMEA